MDNHAALTLLDRAYKALNNADSLRLALEALPSDMIDMQFPHGHAKGSTLLHRAAARNQFDSMTVLLQHGAAVDVLDHNGRTPLFMTMRNAYVKGTRLLLDHGASVTIITDRHGHTPLTALLRTARKPSAWRCAQMVLDKGAQMPADHHVVWRLLQHHYEYHIVQWLLRQKGLNPNAADPTTGNTALHWLAKVYTIEVFSLKILMEHGADVNARNHAGNTPLVVALDNPRTVHFLLSYGADAFAVCADGRTALAIAHATDAASTERIAKAMRIKLTVHLMCAMRRMPGMRDPGRVVGKFFHDMLTVDVLASVGVNTTKRAKP